MGTYSNLNYYLKKIIQRLKVEFQDKDSEFHPKTKATQSPIIQLPAQQLQLRKLHATALLNYDLKQHSQNSHFHHVYQETQQSISSSNMPHQEACLTQRGEKLDLYTNRSQFVSVSRSLPITFFMLHKQKCFSVIFSDNYLHKKELLHKHKYAPIFTKLKILWRSESSEFMHFHHLSS